MWGTGGETRTTLGPPIRTLILHARRSAYGAVRRLSGWASSIAVADHESTVLRSSRLVDAFHRIPDISREGPTTVVAEIRRIIGEDPAEPTVILAAKDDYLELLSRFREDLGPAARFAQEVRPGVLARVLDKRGLPGLAAVATVAVPRTVIDDIGGIAKLRPPMVVKPGMKRRVGLDVERAAFRLRVCATHTEAVRAAGQLVALGEPFIAQEALGGAQPALHTVGLVARNGELVNASTSLKVRQFPRRFGECALGVTTDRPDLVELADRVVAASGMSGIAQLEFIEYGGQPYLLEINPRLWSWHGIHAEAGVDLVRIAAIEALDEGELTPDLRRERDRMVGALSLPGVKWRFAAMDLVHNVGREVSLLQFLRDRSAVDVEAFHEPRDPAVGRAHWRMTLGNLPSLVRAIVRAGRSEGSDDPVTGGAV